MKDLSCYGWGLRHDYPGSFPWWRRLLNASLHIIVMLPAVNVLAHTPFESSARITLLEGQIEVAVTVGPGIGRALLRDTGVDPTQATGFAGVIVTTPGVGGRIISLEADDQPVPAQTVRVVGDGLEATLLVTFPRPASGVIRLSANYAVHVPAGAVSPLVITDEQGRMIGSHVVTSGDNSVELVLPPAPVPATIAVAEAPVPSDPTVAPTPAHRRAISDVRLGIIACIGGLLLVAVLLLRRNRARLHSSS